MPVQMNIHSDLTGSLGEVKHGAGFFVLIPSFICTSDSV